MRKLFDKIRLSQLQILCNIIADTEVRGLSNIKRRYLENAIEFDRTLLFLKELKIVQNRSDVLLLSKSFTLTHNLIDDFKKEFLPILFSANVEISEQLRNFLLNFQTAPNHIFFKATDKQKIKFSDIRNLLLELEFITASSDNRTYFIHPDYSDLFMKQFSNSILSPETLKRKQVEKEIIGLKAEKAVVEFETMRLKNILNDLKEIEHTSLKNVLAGYDIKSFENFLDTNSKRIDRYIEVKAVSFKDFKFYWSKNEMEIAKVFGEKYFLYLLPVVSNNTFDFENLMIVNNPFKNINLNTQEWKKKEECISFSKNNGE